jgi:hypothetical protein
LKKVQVAVGDSVVTIKGTPTTGLRHSDITALMLQADSSVEIALERGHPPGTVDDAFTFLGANLGSGQSSTPAGSNGHGNRHGTRSIHINRDEKVGFGLDLVFTHGKIGSRIGRVILPSLQGLIVAGDVVMSINGRPVNAPSCLE